MSDISERRRLPDGSYDLTGRDMSEALDEFYEDNPDFDERKFMQDRIAALEKRNALLEAQVRTLTERLDATEADE